MTLREKLDQLVATWKANEGYKDVEATQWHPRHEAKPSLYCAHCGQELQCWTERERWGGGDTTAWEPLPDFHAWIQILFCRTDKYMRIYAVTYEERIDAGWVPMKDRRQMPRD